MPAYVAFMTGFWEINTVGDKICWEAVRALLCCGILEN